MSKYNRDNYGMDFPADLWSDWLFFSASEIVELEIMICVRQSEETEQILFSNGRSRDVSPQVMSSTVSTVGVSPLLFGFEQLLSRSVTTDSRGANYLGTSEEEPGFSSLEQVVSEVVINSSTAGSPDPEQPTGPVRSEGEGVGRDATRQCDEGAQRALLITASAVGTLNVHDELRASDS